MPQTSYAYAVARIRVLENKLLTQDKLERMIDAPAGQDVIKILAESEFALGVDITNPADYELLLAKELTEVYDLIKAITPDWEAVSLYIIKYDIHNLKVLIKERFLDNHQEKLLMDTGIISVDRLKDAVANKDYKMLPAFLREVLGILDNQLSLKVDPQRIDSVLDKALYSYIFSVCKKKKDGFLLSYFNKMVDLTNIKSLLRVKKMGEGFDFLKELLLPGGSLATSFYSRAMDESLEQLISRMEYGDYGRVITEGIQSVLKDGSLTVYERLMDNYLLDFVKADKNNPFGMEAIIGYLLAKENEIKLVRMIMVAKINNISGDKLRERLRDVYV